MCIAEINSHLAERNMGDRILFIKDVYTRSLEYFGEDYLRTKDTNNPITNSWIHVERAYEIEKEESINVVMPQAKELIVALNFYEIFRKLEVVDHSLNIVDDKEAISWFHHSTIHSLKKKATYEATLNFIALPAFLENKPIEIYPIIESDYKTPDYLVKYKGHSVLIECKSSELKARTPFSLKNKTCKIVKKAKKQLANYSDYPGICQFKTNEKEVFESQQGMIELAEKQIDRDGNNLAAIMFTYYKDLRFPKSVILKHLLLINFRSTVLLPQGFYKDVFAEKGVLVIASRVGDKHSFEEIKKICEHYNIDPKLDELEEKFS